MHSSSSRYPPPPPPSFLFRLLFYNNHLFVFPLLHLETSNGILTLPILRLCSFSQSYFPQATCLDEARELYDQLAPVTSIMLALSGSCQSANSACRRPLSCHNQLLFLTPAHPDIYSRSAHTVLHT